MRFLNRPEKMYTYYVESKVKLGDLLVVENEHGTTVVAVVQLNPPLPGLFPMKTISKKVVAL